MSRSYRLWYLLVLVVALAPPGLRMLFWQGGRPILVDPAMAQAGEVLFNHKWELKDKLSPDGDGLGPVYNASSCVACHNQAGPGGGGGVEHNVTTFTVRTAGMEPRQGVVHAFGGESLRDVHPQMDDIHRPTLAQLVNLQGRAANTCIPFPRGVHFSQRNTPALFGVKLIDEIPERDIIAGATSQKLRWGLASATDEEAPVGRAAHLADGHVGRFGWKAQIASLSEFVQAACANELGLSNPGHAQPTPLFKPFSRQPTGLDLTSEQCDQITAFCASLPRPEQRLSKGISADQATAGERLFGKAGCADCHVPKLGSVDGIYSDLLLHAMGPELVGGGSYGEPPLPVPNGPDEGPSPSDWRTPPLWGVADSAPYFHDGASPTLEAAIQRHAGDAQVVTSAYRKLTGDEQTALLTFLGTLRAPRDAKPAYGMQQVALRGR